VFETGGETLFGELLLRRMMINKLKTLINVDKTKIINLLIWANIVEMTQPQNSEYPIWTTAEATAINRRKK
jgi:hypothetical protein